MEYKVKAAYLYNFTKFITWPEKASPTFNICIIGNDPFGKLLDPLESKTVLDKPIRLYRFESAKQAKDCDIVYFDNTDQRADLAIPGVLLIGSLKKALTVSSQPFFAESGGMIGFALDDEKVKLHINLKALKQSGLNVSAKLLEVATLVEGGEHE
ncbi:YfiR family protein [Methylomonas montana]|uniref:YfiR family protein n=1 Tax=Methylomonas montana TaxID=3058963 RepID=UPI0026596B1E|nr:YfiR family protein [Methylomonas montana]WKJ89654.1 YfiR family protein [Methylomonas montana]